MIKVDSIHLLTEFKRKCIALILFGVSIDPDTGETAVLIYRIRHSAQRYLEGLEMPEESESS